MMTNIIKYSLATSLAFCLLPVLNGCQNEEIAAQNDLARERIWRGEKPTVVRYPWQEKLSADNLNEDSATLTRILTMSNDERQHRLPSFVMENSNKILFNRGTSRQLQEAASTFHTDSRGNFHFTQKIGRDDVEYIMVDDTLYARYVNGPFRSKASLNQPIDLLRELSAQSISESLAPWQNYFVLSNAEQTSFSGRPAQRYTISRKNLAEEAKPAPRDDSVTDTNWREIAWPTDIKGELLVDSESAVLLKAHINVKADIFDRPAQATSLDYTFDSHLSNVLKAAAVEPPAASIEEYTVVKSFRGGKFRPRNEASKQ